MKFETVSFNSSATTLGLQLTRLKIFGGRHFSGGSKRLSRSLRTGEDTITKCGTRGVRKDETRKRKGVKGNLE
jgi:hypothetical protein